MMKLKDFLCLLAGVALLALAFQVKGFLEEATPYNAFQAQTYDHMQTEEEIHPYIRSKPL